MEIIKTLNGNTLTLQLNGRLDTITAPELEAVITTELEKVNELIIDCTYLEYISSAGLRVLLSAQKVMNRQGEMIIRNASPEILEIFEVTGFVDILKIEGSRLIDRRNYRIKML